MKSGGIKLTRDCLFGIFLVMAAWQDLRTKSVGNRFLFFWAFVGAAVCAMEKLFWKDVLISCGIGVVLLGFCRVSGGGIGEGDGWFFVVTGMYLSWMENLQLLMSGLFFCFVWSLPLAVRSILKNGAGRKQELPFLPFLLPAGIWMAVTS